METRLSQSTNIGFERPHVEVAHYTMLKHQPSPVNPKRRHLLKVAHTRYSKDGLNSVNYLLKQKIDYKLYTHFHFDVGNPPANIFSDESNVINKNNTNNVTLISKLNFTQNDTNSQ